MLNSKGLLLITILFVLAVSGKIYGENTVIKWNPVYGAGGYIVEIVDSDNKPVIKQEVKDTSVDVGKLQPGIYKYRITTLNKLRKAGGSTGWLTLTIQKEDPTVASSKDEVKDEIKDGVREEVKEEDGVVDSNDAAIQEETVAADPPKDEPVKDRADKPFKMYYVLGIGWEYNIPLSPWSDMLDPSYMGLNLYFSFPLGVIKPVRGVPFISSLCVDVQLSYIQYTLAEDRPYLGSPSFLTGGFHTGLNYPIPLDFIFPKMQLLLNIDPGLSYSKFKRSIYGDSYKTTSYDFSFITGATVRYFWTNMIFTDVSAQYYRIQYVSHPFNDAKLVLRVGVKL